MNSGLCLAEGAFQAWYSLTAGYDKTQENNGVQLRLSEARG